MGEPEPRTDPAGPVGRPAEPPDAPGWEAVGRLAVGVAHDVNNLLTVINGFAELLATGADPGDPARPELEEIRKAGARAGGLTAHLLAYARRRVLPPRVLDLNALVSDAVGLLRPLLGPGVALSVDAAPALRPVRADPARLEQVVVNLAVNARDAMPGGGRLTLRTANVGPAGPGAAAEVLLEVTDTGVGMDEATRARLFEPFFTTTAAGRGSGLGLGGARAAVAEAGGRVTVRTAPGRGSTFGVYLPACGGVAPGTGPVPATPAALGGTETVLVAEPDAGVRSLVRAVLGGAGYSVLEAAGGPEAAEVIRAHPVPIDLVVAEFAALPTVCRAGAAWPPRPRVLLLGAGPDDGPAPGLGEPLPKPFATRALLLRVRAALDASDPAAADDWQI